MKKKVLELSSKLKAMTERFGSEEMGDSDIDELVCEFMKLDDPMRVRFFNDLYRASINGWNAGAVNMTATGFSNNMIKIFQRVKPFVDAAVAKLRPDLLVKNDDTK